MSTRVLDSAYAAAIQALSAPGDDALSKADAEGFPDWNEVVGWAERLKSLVLHQRDRGSLRAELPALGERLLRFLERLPLPEGATPEEVVARFIGCLPEVRARLAEDVEAALEGDPAAKSFGEIVAAYPAIHAIASYRLAHLYAATGRRELARATMSAIPADARLTARERLYLDAASALFQDDYSGAIASYEKLLAEYPYDVEGRQFLAEAYFLDYQSSEAIEELRKLGAQEPENEFVWSALGTYLILAGRPEEARASLQRYRTLAPEDPQLLNDTAVLLHHDLDRELGTADGMYRRAIALAEAALADPELPAADRERFATALDDARKNLTELEYLLERRARGEHRAGKGG